SVFVEVCDRVEQGKLLALIDSAEVGRAKAELREAIARADVSTRRRERLKNSGPDVGTRATLEGAEVTAREALVAPFNAEQALGHLGLPVRASELQGLDDPAVLERLRYLGLPREALPEKGSTLVTANLMPVLAPFEGVVIERGVVHGEVVDPARTLM